MKNPNPDPCVDDATDATTEIMLEAAGSGLLEVLDSLNDLDEFVGTQNEGLNNTSSQEAPKTIRGPGFG